MPSARTLLISLFLVLLAAAPAQASGPFPITETFRGTTMEPGWVTSGTAALTGPAGDGWMRLTPATNNAANEELGLARAKAVCRYLHARGVKATYSTASRGETRPRASNRTANGRALNRRVELTVTRR